MNQVNTDIGRIVTGAKRDPMEVLLGAGIISGIQAILTHCSPEIFKVHEYSMCMSLYCTCTGTRVVQTLLLWSQLEEYIILMYCRYWII